MELLQARDYEIVTFRKCIYELYSIIRGTTKDPKPGKNHPLKNLLVAELNDIGQKLFKNDFSIDMLPNTWHWFGSYDGQDEHSFVVDEGDIEKYVIPEDKLKAKEFLQRQKIFWQWRNSLEKAYSEIDDWVEINGIRVCEYVEMYSSDWFLSQGFSFEHHLAKNSLLPNEDFEIILSALYLQARIFISEDDDIIRRSSISLGLTEAGPIAFCRVDKLQEAFDSDLMFRFYA